MGSALGATLGIELEGAALQLPLPYNIVHALRLVAHSSGRHRAALCVGEAVLASRAPAGADECCDPGCCTPEAVKQRVAEVSAGPQQQALEIAACKVFTLAARAASDAYAGKEASQDAAGDATATAAGESEVEDLIRGVALGCGRFWGHTARGRAREAHRHLCRALAAFRQLHWRTSWRGANLGGWLLLEPGPASPFYDRCLTCVKDLKGKKPKLDPPDKWDFEDEHALCQALESYGGRRFKEELFQAHRAHHYSDAHFKMIATSGLNAVRIPFGYWVVDGPGEGESFVGPCLDVLDRAVELATKHRLQVLLDLHGNPGGENGGRPSGRVDPEWRWQDWRPDDAVEILRKVAARYKNKDCVTGIQVCNEPDASIPATELCDFYEKATTAIRDAGMGPDRVAVVLPIFTHWRIGEIVECWRRRGNFLRYDNIAFDLHYYHVFNPLFQRLSHEQHMEMVAEHARELAQLPGAVVAEWSLARDLKDVPEEKMQEFAVKQVMAYNHASHGWFFWNWHDFDFYPSWDMERGVFNRKRLPMPLTTREKDQLLFEHWAKTGPPEGPYRYTAVPMAQYTAVKLYEFGTKAKMPRNGRSFNWGGGCFSFVQRPSPSLPPPAPTTMAPAADTATAPALSAAGDEPKGTMKV